MGLADNIDMQIILFFLPAIFAWSRKASSPLWSSPPSTTSVGSTLRSKVTVAESSGSVGSRGIILWLILFRTLFSLVICDAEMGTSERRVEEEESRRREKRRKTKGKETMTVNKTTQTLTASSSALSLQERSIWNWISRTSISFRS